MGVYRLIVEPWAVARLPFQTADHTKLRCASARHMIAAFFQLDHCRTTKASLPALLLRNLNKGLRVWVFRTLERLVHLIVANAADTGIATLAATHLSALLNRNMIRLDPLATTMGWAVDPVASVVFLEFSVPRLLEVLVEQLLHVF